MLQTLAQLASTSSVANPSLQQLRCLTRICRRTIQRTLVDPDGTQFTNRYEIHPNIQARHLIRDVVESAAMVPPDRARRLAGQHDAQKCGAIVSVPPESQRAGRWFSGHLHAQIEAAGKRLMD